MRLDITNVFFSLVFLQQRKVPQQRALAAAVGAGLIGGPIGLALPVMIAGTKQGTLPPAPGEPGTVVVEVPDIVKKPEDAAVRTLTDRGLTPRPQVLYSADKPEGIVLRQAPTAGTVVELESEVTFVVPRKPEEPVTEDEKEDKILAVVEEIKTTSKQTLAKVEEYIGPASLPPAKGSKS